MSVKVMTAVFERYPVGGGEMILALALADHADDDGTRVFPSIDSLMVKTRQARRTVQYQLRRMEESGWLILVNSGNGGRNQHREYRINLDWINGGELPEPENKGANNAPINNSENSAKSAPLNNDEKGASDDTKGANHDTKGCNSEHERVQQGAPAYNHHRTTIEPSNNHQRARASRAVEIDLPEWLPDDVWQDWVEHRKAVKAPLTKRAAELCLRKLDRLRVEGHCPIAVIEQSVITGKWTDLYPVKNDRLAPAAGSNRSSSFDPVAYVNRNRTQQGGGDVIDV